MLKSLQCFVLGILLLVPSAHSHSQTEPGRLPKEIVPLSQRIELTIDANKDRYEGVVEIQIRVNKSGRSIQFHAEQIDIQEILLTTGTQTSPLTWKKAPFGMIDASARQEFTPGDYTLSISFTNDFNTNGVGLFMFEEEGERYTCTHFESIRARQAFPCWDEPGFKIPYTLVLSIPESHQAFGNAPEAGRKTSGGTKTIEFQPTKPLPAYLITFATGPYETIPMPGCSVPGRIITTQGKTRLAIAAVKEVPTILDALEDYFMEPYPFEKLDILAIPTFDAGAMENPGLLVYMDINILQDSALATFSEKRRQVNTHAHELSHMWFGNKVTMKWWDDIWLNEAFAEWMGDRTTDRLYPQYRFNIASTQSALRTMKTDQLPAAKPIARPIPAGTDPDEGFDNLTYDKGRAIIAMTENWLGEAVFQSAIVDFVRSYAWSNANREDLWTSMQMSTGKDVKRVMAGFVQQAGVPLIRVHQSGTSTVTITQERFTNFATSYEGNATWTIPVNLAYSDGDRKYTTTVLLDQEKAPVNLQNQKPLDWLYPNTDAVGYYRFWMDPEQMLNLTQRSQSALSLPERVALIDNLSAQMDGGNLAGDNYLKQLLFFRDDSDTEVIQALVSQLVIIYRTFVRREGEPGFARYVRELLQPALDRLGLHKRPDEIQAAEWLRPRLMMALGMYAMDGPVLRMADSLSQRYETDAEKADASLMDAALVLAASRGDRRLFDHFKARFGAVTTPMDRFRYASALGSFRDSSILRNALDFSLDEEVGAMDLWGILIRVSRQIQHHQMLLGWFKQNYEDIVAKCPPGYIPHFLHFFDTCTPEQVEELKTFMFDPQRKTSFIEQEMNLVSDRSRFAQKLREKESGNISRFLTGR